MDELSIKLYFFNFISQQFQISWHEEIVFSGGYFYSRIRTHSYNLYTRYTNERKS